MTKRFKKPQDPTVVSPRPFNHPNHPAPVTRREFLAQGALATSGLVLLPTLTSLIAPRAYAQNVDSCAPKFVDGRIPFIVFDMAGGGNIAGSNVMVGKKEGQMDYLNDYTGLGVMPARDPKTVGVDSTFGLAFHPDSAFLGGMKAATSTTTRERMDGIVFCAASNDDTKNNPHNPAYWIAKSGTVGKLVALAGNTDDDSGGNSKPGIGSYDPSFRPVKITRPNDATGIVDPGRLAQLLSRDRAQRVMKAVERMSMSQLGAFEAHDLPSKVRELASCGYINATALPFQKDSSGKFLKDYVDPVADTQIVSGFGGALSPSGGGGTERETVASITKLVLDGYAGAGTVSKGGFDYHQNVRQTTDGRDYELGLLVGEAFEAAAAKGKNLMVYVFTDGGLFANGQTPSAAGVLTVNGSPVTRTDLPGVTGANDVMKYQFSGDDGDKSAAFILAYRAGSQTRSDKPLLRSEFLNKRQVGWYSETNKLGVDRQAVRTSNDVTTLSKAIVLNYLALAGRENELADVVGDNPFSSAMSTYLAFNKF